MSTSLLKKLGIVTVVLVLAWIVYLYRMVPHEKTPYARAADQTEKITLEQAAKSVVLQHEANAWKVGTSSGPFYAADGELVKPLLAGLKVLQLEDEISNRADRATDYDLTPETGVHIRLQNGLGTTIGEGLFGKQAPDISHLYFRFVDKPTVYLVRGLTKGDLGRIDVNFWRSHVLLDIPEDKIQAIQIDFQGSKTELVRVSTDAWTLNGQPVDQNPVNTVVGALAHLRADDFIDPATNPLLTYDSLTFAHIQVKAAGGSADIRFGPQDMTSKRYLVSTGIQVGLAWLPEASAKALLKKPSDFKPPKVPGSSGK